MMLKGSLGYPSHIPYKEVSITRLAPLLFAHPDLTYIFALQTSGKQEWVAESLLCPLLPPQPGGNGHSGN